MTSVRWSFPLLICACAFPITAKGQTFHTERGAALGGIGGALAGAAVGNNNGNTGAGALIGGALGLVTGAVIGNSMDEKARLQAYEQQQYVRLSRAVSTSDIVSMTQNGLSDEVIINHVRENGVQRRLEVNDVIMLHKHGVSEHVITAMQNATVGRPVVYSAPPPRYHRPAVIVEEHYYAPPAYWCPPPRYHHYHHHHHPHSHFHWGFSVGH